MLLVGLANLAVFLGWTTARQPAAPAVDIVQTLAGHTELVYSIAYSPDGKLIATGSFDKAVKLWDAATGKEVKTFGGPTGHQNLVLSVTFSPDGRQIASAGHGQHDQVVGRAE
jgi:WD40 repeat protein